MANTGDAQDDTEALLRSAKELREARQFEAALSQVNRVLRMSPSAEAYRVQGNVFYDMGLYENARASYVEATRLDADDYKSFFNLGNTLTDLGRYSEAIDYFTRTLAIEHDYVEGYINRGVAYWYLQKYDEALADFTRATRYARLQVQARNNKALTELALDRKEEALRTINELLDNPRGEDIAPALNTKGSILYQMGKYDEALSIFNEAIRKFGEQAEYCYNRGLVYHKQKKYDLAITDYDRAISKNPSFAEAYSNRAAAYADKGVISTAIADAHKAIELKPALSQAHANLVKFIQMQEVNGDSRISNAFDFWKSSQYKKAAAVALVVFALSTSLSLPFIFYSQTIDTEQIVDRGGGNKTITNTKVTTTPHEVSATYFIIPGLAILILLVPMLRKVNLGPLELELAEPVTSVAK